MTFDEFVDEWRSQVREYGGCVPQEAIDMAEEAWQLARTNEREECAKVCRTQYDLRGASDDHKYMADKCALEIMRRSNA